MDTATTAPGGNQAAVEMSLNKKILGILLALMTLAAIMDSAVHRWVIYPNYASLERAQAEKDLARCVAALEDEIEHLSAFTNDWAAWDDTYRFIADRNPAYIDSNLGGRTFLDNRLNLIAFYTSRGRRIWGRTYNLATGKTVPIHPLDAAYLSPDHPLLKRTGQDSPINGIYATDRGPMLIASRPIITSERRGPARGSLIMGRLLDPALEEHLRDKTQVNHRFWSLEAADLARGERQAMRRIDSGASVFTRATKQNLQVYTLVPGIAGTPGMLLRADVSRQITARGLAMIRYAIVSDALVTIAILIVSFGLLQRTVIRPLSRLTRCAVGIGAGKYQTTGCVDDRDDEIGILGREFKRMVRRLRNSHQGLLREIDEHRRSRAMLDTYHDKLRRLSSKLFLAEEDERRRIAVELHDRVGQSLTVSKMRLDALAACSPEDREASRIREVGDILEKTIADTRMLTFELSPPVLYEFGLGAALEWLCEKFGREHDLDIDYHSDADALPQENHLRVMLFQAARELLFNTVKHARATRVRVRMAVADTRLEITIEDDGRGFQPVRINADSSGNPGFGLFSIRERLDDLGGALDIRSESGRGTRVSLRCPLSPNLMAYGTRKESHDGSNPRGR
jgi:signal transduction histidine kinase